MEIQFLGTGAGLPARHRNVSSLALNLVAEINEVWLFDCGEGTQRQILQTNIRPRKIKKIFITHMHGDHIFGLPGLLSSRSFQNGDDKPSDIEIYGPKGLKDFILTSLRLSQTKLNYSFKFHELKDGEVLLETSEFKVETRLLAHGIPCFGFRIVEKDHEGELQVEKLKELGIPSGPIYGQIKRGETVTLENGQTINGKDFIGAKKKGRVLAILGDTRKTGQAILLAKNADIFVHEATYEEGMEKKASKHFHSTNRQAAMLAKEANAKRLLLNHLSARFLLSDNYSLEKQAQSVFKDTHVVKDFEIVEVPMPHE